MEKIMDGLMFSSGLLCLVVPAFLCLVPLLAIALFMVGKHSSALPTQRDDRHFINRVLLPNPLKLQHHVETMRRRHPQLDTDILVQKVIDKAAFNAGFVGFITGIPGLPAVPVTVPLDFVATGRIQTAMIQTIAYAYGRVDDLDDEDISAKKTYLIMVGGSEAVVGINQLVGQLLLRVTGKWIFEVIPILGGFIGFALNYYLTKVIGKVAIKHYTGQLQVSKMVGSTKSQLAQQKQAFLMSRTSQHQEAKERLLSTDDSNLIPSNRMPTDKVIHYQQQPSHPQHTILEYVTCTFCDSSNPASHRFCSICGSQIQA